eukprot:3018952-Ditylum_brightwellii.AAC.1
MSPFQLLHQLTNTTKTKSLCNIPGANNESPLTSIAVIISHNGGHPKYRLTPTQTQSKCHQSCHSANFQQRY